MIISGFIYSTIMVAYSISASQKAMIELLKIKGIVKGEKKKKNKKLEKIPLDELKNIGVKIQEKCIHWLQNAKI